MAPVMDAKDEADENVPKMLCLLDNHSGLYVIFFGTKIPQNVKGSRELI